jgi:GcrA cell cycle regulator
MRRRIYDREAVLDLWAEHKTSPEIFALTGVPIAPVVRIAGRARKAGDPRAISHRAAFAPSDFWTSERVDQLTRNWAEGLSGSAIGQLIGATRSAVIGKVHRLGLPARAPRRKDTETAAKPKRPRTQKTRRREDGARKPRAPGGPERASLLEPVSLDIALVDLERGQCKYPHGEGPYTFCGHQVFPGEVYCPAHCAIAYRPYEPEPRPRPRARRFHPFAKTWAMA